MDKENIDNDYNSLGKSYRKSVKDSKELQAKHEKTCSSLKDIKNEKNQVSKEFNAIYVALVTNKRNLQDHLKLCCQGKSDLKKERTKLQEYKEEKGLKREKLRKMKRKVGRRK